MKKQFLYLLITIALCTSLAFSVHKFHAALYQIKFSSEKKMVQITSRIHIEDINKALEAKFKRKVFIGDDRENQEDVKFLKEYLNKNFTIKINGQHSPINFLSKEIEADEIVCYGNIKGISKINSLEIINTVLVDYCSDQQNWVNVVVSGEKKSFILTSSNATKELKY